MRILAASYPFTYKWLFQQLIGLFNWYHYQRLPSDYEENLYLQAVFLLILVKLSDMIDLSKVYFGIILRIILETDA